MFKKIVDIAFRFWAGIWNVVKTMTGWKGILSLILTWTLMSGIGLIGVGLVIGSKALIASGTVVWVFWLGPFTPLIPLVIAISLLVQRFIFRDKNIKLSEIKDKFKQAFQKEKKEEEENNVKDE